MARKAIELNTILPFIPSVAGPMDFTFVAFSLEIYHQTTTAAHEIATATIFTSGIVYYADSPAALDRLPAEKFHQICKDRLHHPTNLLKPLAGLLKNKRTTDLK